MLYCMENEIPNQKELIVKAPSEGIPGNGFSDKGMLSEVELTKQPYSFTSGFKTL